MIRWCLIHFFNSIKTYVLQSGLFLKATTVRDAYEVTYQAMARVTFATVNVGRSVKVHKTTITNFCSPFKLRCHWNLKKNLFKAFTGVSWIYLILRVCLKARFEIKNLLLIWFFIINLSMAKVVFLFAYFARKIEAPMTMLVVAYRATLHLCKWA